LGHWRVLRREETALVTVRQSVRHGYSGTPQTSRQAASAMGAKSESVPLVSLLTARYAGCFFFARPGPVPCPAVICPAVVGILRDALASGQGRVRLLVQRGQVLAQPVRRPADPLALRDQGAGTGQEFP
jgi:hypothetical protein